MSGKLQRTLYRNLLRLARNFDAPVLKALICRNHGAPLPPSLDAVVAQFLGSPQAHYYWPGPGEPQRRVRDAVRSAFRSAADAQMEDAFAGMRYLSGLLAVARKHGLTDAAASGPALAAQPASSSGFASSSGGDGSASVSRGTSNVGRGGSQQVQAVPVPTQGSVLLAHPCLLGSIFSRSAVLLCRHDPLTGSYGLVLNKPLGTSLKDLHEKMKQLGSSLGDAAHSSSSSSSSSSSTDASPFSSSRDGSGGGGRGSGVLHDRGAAALAPGACDGDSSTSSNVEAEGEAGGGVPAAQSLQAALLEFARAAPNPPSPEYVAAVGAALRALGFTLQQQEAQDGPRDEHDEYGNWIESPYDSDDDAELAGGGEGEGGEHDGSDGSGADGTEVVWAAVSSDGEDTGWHGGYGSSAEEQQQDSEEEEEEEEEEAGVSRSQAAVRALEAARSAGSRDIGSLLRDALRGGDQGGEGGDVQLQLTEPDHDPSGVLAAMGEAVRLAGGGTAVLLDSAGHLWTHFLPSTAESPEELQHAGGSQAGQASSSSSSSSSSGEAVLAAEDNAAAIASLLLRCLTPSDRQLLAEQQQAALQERWQRLHSNEQRQQQPLQKHQMAAQPPPACNLREQLEAAPAAACKSSKARRFGAEVQRLLADVAAAFTEPSEPGQGRLQAGGSSSSSSSGSGGASSLSSSGGDEAPTVGMLMGLFGGSPLFRGGPVPGVQVLHRRPLLGGELVLAPGGCQLSTGGEAAGDEAEAEGGLLVGADLRRAQALSDAGYLSPADVRVCMGDSAWAGGQLQAEVDSGTWAVVNTTPEFLDLFGTSAALASDLQANMGGGGVGTEGGGSTEGGSDTSSTSPAQQYEEELWGRCLRSLGGEYAELARVPAGVWADLALLEV